MTSFIPTLRLIAAAAGVCLLAGSLTPVLAQTPADGGPAPTSPTAVPLDGGASLLLAAGAAYGLKRLRGARRAKAK